MKVQKRLKPPLRDFRLIGGIGRVPRRVFKNVALDRGRGDRAVIPLTDKRGHHLVLLGGLAHVMQQLAFRFRLAEIQWLFLSDRLGHGFIDQLLKRLHTKGFEHIAHLGRGRADMTAVGEIVGQVVDRLVGHGKGSSG